jgi:hypothetical protein
MRRFLKLHPDSRCLAVTHIEVGMARPRPDNLVLSYTVTGNIGGIKMPPVTANMRSDELWRHTCFELFVGTSLSPEYYEFNFAPSTQWAAYRFSAFRSGMREATEIGAIPIEVQSSPNRCTLQASVELDRLSGLSRNAMWRFGLSALIEETTGGKSCWALAHPPGKPDFHHVACFEHEFSPAVQT